MINEPDDTPVTHRVLWQKLSAAGWKRIKGNPHDMAIDPENPNHAIPIPHKHKHKNKDIPEGTVRNILRQARIIN
jgi:predicted RNA binding protein YcfA (HicA-like mRNA interferase family)